MWPFKTINNSVELDEKLKKLGDLLRKERVNITSHKRDMLREHLLKEIAQRPQEIEGGFTFENLIRGIREIALTTVPAPVFVAALRERLMAAPRTIMRYSPMRTFFSKPAVSFLVGVMFVLTVVFGFTFEVDSVRAESLARLASYGGTVSVVRNGDVIQLKNMLTLQVGDLLKTGENSHAAVRFVDNSIIRLGPETEVTIESLILDPEYGADTSIAVSLLKGKVWSRVISLMNGKSDFQVKTPKARAKVKKQATFSMEVKEDAVKVRAVKNTVDVAFAEDNKVHEKTIVSGFSLDLTDDVAPVLSGETDDPEEKEWIAGNLESDEAYVAEYFEEKRVASKSNPLEPLKDDTGDVKRVAAVTQRVIEAQESVAYGNAESVVGQVDKLNEELAQLSFSDGDEKLVEESLDLLKSVHALKNGVDIGNPDTADAVNKTHKAALFALGASLMGLQKGTSDSIHEAELLETLESLDISGQRITAVRFGEGGVQLRGQFEIPVGFEESTKVLGDDAVLLQQFTQFTGGETLVTLQRANNEEDAHSAIAQFAPQKTFVAKPGNDNQQNVSAGAAGVVAKTQEPENKFVILDVGVVGPEEVGTTAMAESDEQKPEDTPPEWIELEGVIVPVWIEF